MSIRSLFEINHDFGRYIEDEKGAFARLLDTYIRSGSRESAEPLERYGLRLISQRHHSGEYRDLKKHDGFANAARPDEAG